VYHLGPHHSLEFCKSIQPVHNWHDVVSVQHVSFSGECPQLFVDTGQKTLQKVSVSSWTGNMLLDYSKY
jgi:hypothetical protein